MIYRINLKFPTIYQFASLHCYHLHQSLDDVKQLFIINVVTITVKYVAGYRHMCAWQKSTQTIIFQILCVPYKNGLTIRNHKATAKIKNTHAKKKNHQRILFLRQRKRSAHTCYSSINTMNTPFIRHINVLFLKF